MSAAATSAGSKNQRDTRDERDLQAAQTYALKMFDEWRRYVDGRLSAVETGTNSIQSMVAAQPTRRDLEEALRSRVDVGTYTAAHQALLDRVSRLESGPQRLVAWISLMVSAGMGCLMMLLSGASVLIALGGLIFALTR